MPFEVAPAPVPSWEREKKEVGGGSAGVAVAAAKPRGLDAAFLCRLHLSVAYVGVLALLLVSAASTSVAATAFGAGYGLGWALLASQGFVVGRAMRRTESKAQAQRQMVWWMLVPLKYLLVAALLGWVLREAKMSAAWLAFGFGSVQFLMLAKTFGRAMSGNIKTVRQAYIERG